MQLKHASDVMKSQECKVGQQLLAEPDSTTLEHADEVNDSLYLQAETIRRHPRADEFATNN